MKVKKLIEKLSTMDPETEVVVSGSDHSYRRVSEAIERKAEVVGRKHLSEYYDVESMSAPDNDVVTVLLIV